MEKKARSKMIKEWEYSIRNSFHSEILEKIKENPSLLQLKTKENDSFLTIASHCGRFLLVKYGLANGLNVHHKNIRGDDSILIASREGHIEIVKLLILHGANIDSFDGNGESVLMASISINNILLSESIIRLGASLDHLDRYGKTALIEATQKGFYEMVLFLLYSGANIDIADKRGRTALFHSVEECLPRLTQLLVDAGADEHISSSVQLHPTLNRTPYTNRITAHKIIDSIELSPEQRKINWYNQTVQRLSFSQYCWILIIRYKIDTSIISPFLVQQMEDECENLSHLIRFPFL